MKFEGFDVPEGAVTASISELREELAEVKTWFQTTTRSLELIQQSCERTLTREEAATVAKDFLSGGLLMAAMSMRNEHIVKAANHHIAKETAPDLIANIEKLLKGET